MEAIVNIVRMQTPRIRVRPLGRLALWLNYFLRPLMCWLTYPGEEPQSTHPWNNTKLTAADVRHLDDALMVVGEGDANASVRWLYGFIPMFHLPRFGGWTNYIVIGSHSAVGELYTGWIADDVIGVCRMPAYGAVRKLRGRGPAKFFGLNRDGEQVPLRIVGHGYIGDEGPYANVLLR